MRFATQKHLFFVSGKTCKLTIKPFIERVANESFVYELIKISSLKTKTINSVSSRTPQIKKLFKLYAIKFSFIKNINKTFVYRTV